MTATPDADETGAEFTGSADTIVVRRERRNTRILALPVAPAVNR